MYRYDAELVLDNGTYPIHQRSVSIVPPNVPIHYRYTQPVEHFFLHFSLDQASEDANPVHFPVMFDWGKILKKSTSALSMPRAVLLSLSIAYVLTSGVCFVE